MLDIQLPYNHKPRDYMLPFWEALDSGVKRVGAILPRRAGKTITSVNATFRNMFLNVGSHFHYFPEYKQGRTVVWDGSTFDKNTGEAMRFLDFMPKHLLYGKPNQQEMAMRVVNPNDLSAPGSIYKILGSDKIDRSVGSNPIWVIFDEYSLSNPQSWDYIRPVLKENGGVAIFLFTPRGKNHAYRLWQSTKNNPSWFWMKLTVDDTGHFTKEELQQEREEIIATTGDDALFWQEYYTDFDAPVQGSVYGTFMRDIEQQGRIRSVPHDPSLVVHTSWDLGRGDNTVVWFVQLDPFGEYRIIDHYSSSGEDIVHYFNVLKRKEIELGYVYGGHYLPHDANAKRIETKRSVYDMMCEFFPSRYIHVVPRIEKKYQRIELVRQMLRRCYFDDVRTEHGRDGLTTYAFKYNESTKSFSKEPVHDWASDHADAFGQIFQYIYPRKKQKAIVFPT